MPDGHGDLDRARELYAAGAVAEAALACAGIIERATGGSDPDLVAGAATLVPRPMHPLLRARVHALAVEAHSLLRRSGAGGQEASARVAAYIEATRDVYADASEVTVVLNDIDVSRREFAELMVRVSTMSPLADHDERLALARRAVGLGLALEDREMQAWGWMWALHAYALTGQRAELLGCVPPLIVLAEQLGPAWQSKLLLVRAAQALTDGRFEDSDRLATRAAEIGGPFSDAAFLQLPFLWESARARGTAGDVLDQIRERVEELPFVARTWLCAALLSCGRRQEAVDEWRALAPRVVAVPPEAPEALIVLVDGADLCVSPGDEASAVPVYESLAPYATNFPAGAADGPYGQPVALHLGRLARFLGDLPAATEHLECALRLAETIHAMPAKAYALAELAALAPMRSRTRRDRAAAALELAQRLGMTPLVDSVREFMSAGTGSDHGVKLTPREAEIAALVADGLSNPAIARRLTLSVRTVENHVSSILAKLMLGSRTEIALWYERR